MKLKGIAECRIAGRERTDLGHRHVGPTRRSDRCRSPLRAFGVGATGLPVHYPRWALSASVTINVGAVLDRHHLNDGGVVINGVDDAMVAPSSAVESCEAEPQRRTGSVWVVGDWPVQELDCSRRDLLGELL